MDNMKTSWPRRFINAVPPMPDAVWVGFVCLMLFLLGVGFGLAWRLPPLAPLPERPGLQQQLNALEQRVKALEEKP